MGLRILEYLALIQCAESSLSCDFPLCIEIAFRRWSKFGMQRTRDIRHQSLNLACRIRSLALELLFHIVSRLCDQLLQEMPGDVLATAELLDKNRVALGTFDQVQNAIFRKAGAVVRCNRAHNLLIPASHKHVRYVLANGPSLGNREQMQLALGPGISHQGSSIESLGLAKHGTRNID